jgi:integrase
VSGRRGNGEGSVQQRADGRWCGIASSPDGRRKFVYGRTRQEATSKLRAVQAASAQGMPVPKELLRVDDYLREWLNANQTRLQARTLRAYACLVRVHANPTIGHFRLARLEARHLEKVYGDMMRAGLSARTVQYLHSVLHRALGQAARRGLVIRNVADLVDPPRVRRREMTVLNIAQSQAFIREAASSPHEALYVLAISSGMRQGELLGLRWSDVDLDRGYLSVTHTLERSGPNAVFGEPKTSASRRRVRLTDRAIEALRRHRSVQAEIRLRAGAAWRDLDLVFTNGTGGPLDAHNLVRRDFGRLLERAGLTPIRFHDLRHTAATLLLTKGIHPKVVADMLGHSSVAVTLDTYSHVLEGLHQEAVIALNEVFA